MKRPEYVAIVTNAYRRALDALQEAKTFDLEAEQEELLKIYNRGGFCTGYLKGLFQRFDDPFANHMVGQASKGLNADDIWHAMRDELHHLSGKEPPLSILVSQG